MLFRSHPKKGSITAVHPKKVALDAFTNKAIDDAHIHVGNMKNYLSFELKIMLNLSKNVFILLLFFVLRTLTDTNNVD